MGKRNEKVLRSGILTTRMFHNGTKHDKLLVFLTNNFDLPALTIAGLYLRRWQVELFFKRITQHL